MSLRGPKGRGNPGFCLDCFASLAMTFIMNRIILIILLLCSSAAFSQEDAPFPPMMAGFKIGTMTVHVFKIENGKKVPVKNQEVAIVAFQNDQQVLMLHKPTDDKGDVFFSRIIKDPSFRFALGVLDGETPYVIGGIQMAESEEHKDLDFQIGEGSPNALPPDVAFHADMGGGSEGVGDGSLSETPVSQVKPELTAPKEAPYQKVALILCAFVVALAFIFSLRKRT